MASVYLISTRSDASAVGWPTNLACLKRSSLACVSPMHHVAASPEHADVILFADSPKAEVWNHALSKRFRKKVFIYSTNDRDVPLIPGVYTSAEAGWYLVSHMRSGFYISVIDYDWIQPSLINGTPSYLYSFCGSFVTHPLRRQLIRLQSAQGFISDKSQEVQQAAKSARTYRQWQVESGYVRVLHDSMFVLCPRGVAPTSYRIFEAMKAGRVPVIIADEWVPPIGPNWSEFSLQVPEARLHDVPQILERLADRAPEMGLRASQAWERWFSRQQAFQTVVTWCLQIKEARQYQGLFQHYRPFLQFARPYFFRYSVLRRLLRRDACWGIRGPFGG
jgi:hypothetical protein